MSKPIPVPIEWADVAMLLHEAIVHGRTRDGKVVYGRRRPHVPHGDDPADVNRECARRYVVRFSPMWTDRAVVTEVDPALVVPFIDIAAQITAADEHANRAQRRNVKPPTKTTAQKRQEAVDERAADPYAAQRPWRRGAGR